MVGTVLDGVENRVFEPQQEEKGEEEEEEEEVAAFTMKEEEEFRVSCWFEWLRLGVKVVRSDKDDILLPPTFLSLLSSDNGTIAWKLAWIFSNKKVLPASFGPRSKYSNPIPLIIQMLSYHLDQEDKR